MRHKGPINTRVDFNGQPQAVRLFRSDNGLGTTLPLIPTGTRISADATAALQPPT